MGSLDTHRASLVTTITVISRHVRHRCSTSQWSPTWYGSQRGLADLQSKKFDIYSQKHLERVQGHLHACAWALVCSQPRGNEAIGQAITPDVECSPFLSHSLRQANHPSLGLQAAQRMQLAIKTGLSWALVFVYLDTYTHVYIFIYICIYIYTYTYSIYSVYIQADLQLWQYAHAARQTWQGPVCAFGTFRLTSSLNAVGTADRRSKAWPVLGQQ